LIALLEGESASFAKPGLISLLAAAWGHELVISKRLDPLSIEAPDIVEVARELGTAWRDRKAILPPVKTAFVPPRILGDMRALAAGPSQTSLEGQSAELPQPPLLRWLEFENRLRREVGADSDKIAKLYFTFYAYKFDDPFNPPAGFLEFLHKYDQVPNPDVGFSFFEHPSQRWEVEERNMRAHARRYFTLARLLDCVNYGVLTRSEFQTVIDWVVVDLPPEQRQQIEVDHLWDARYGVDATFHSWAGDLASEDSGAEPTGGNYREAIVQAFTAARNDYRSFYADGTFPERELNRSLDNELRVATNANRVRRLGALESLFDWVEAAAEIVDTGVIDHATLGSLVRIYLTSITDGSLTDPNTLPRLSCDRALLTAVRRLVEAGVVAPEALRELVKTTPDLSTANSVLNGISLLAMSTAPLRTAADIFKSMVVIDSKPSTLRPLVQTFIGSLDQCVRTVQDNFPVPLPGLRRFFLEQDQCLIDYALLKAQLPGLVTPLVGNTTDPLMNGVMRRSMTAFAAVRALPVIRQSETGGPSLLERYVMDEGAEPVEAVVTADLAAVQRSLAVESLSLREQILQARRECFLLHPVGGKVHTLHPMPEDRFNAFRTALGLPQTQFQLIHAGTSLILPPAPTPFELKLLIGALCSEGLVDPEYPELQLAAPMRLGKESCAILGASILLATGVGYEFNRDSFSTNRNDETGFRMIVFDAGSRNDTLPFCNTHYGRTDIQGRRDLSDIDRFQLLQTVLAQREVGGALKGLADPFEEGLRSVLARYNLEHVLADEWTHRVEAGLFDKDLQELGYAHFDASIAPLVAAWTKSFDRSREVGQLEGIVAEVRQLFDLLALGYRDMRDRALADESAFLDEKARLFSL
jgi:hypothetical protein